ncbi:hypothetical protein CPB85DRAFT_1449600 [Mucidula mucida]|nr:hypothetical protein CPB85DRAFT_1449600 [Mucidula mucida]
MNQTIKPKQCVSFVHNHSERHLTDLTSESDVSHKEDTVALSKRPRTDGSIVPFAKRARRVDVATEHGSRDLSEHQRRKYFPTCADRPITRHPIHRPRREAHKGPTSKPSTPPSSLDPLLGERKSKILSQQEREQYLKADEWIGKRAISLPILSLLLFVALVATRYPPSGIYWSTIPPILIPVIHLQLLHAFNRCVAFCGQEIVQAEWVGGR